MDAIRTLADHVISSERSDLPPPAVDAVKTFVLDSFGVAIAGSRGPWVDKLIETVALSGQGSAARVWNSGTLLPAPAAALCNAYQIHNSEFDCIHEAAVVHPMAVVLPASMAAAERAGGVDGDALMTAVALGVDVATRLGVASNAPLRFFRPATAGAMGATAAIGKLMGFDADTLVNAFATAYAQLAGNMQAHTEGSMLLAIQIGFSGRNAVVACDMAAAGIDGPKDLLQGPFGYYALYEGDYDVGVLLADLGTRWQITEVGHKPFPSGRATHGIIDAVLTARRDDGIGPDDIVRISAAVPPLTYGLVGRPSHGSMNVNYARLCAPFAAACALLRGTVDLEDFTDLALKDPVRLALAERIAVLANDNPDDNALTPIDVTIELTDGRRLERTVTDVYGSPAMPMSRAAHLAKFRQNWQSGREPLAERAGEALIAMVDDLDNIADVRWLVDPMVSA